MDVYPNLYWQTGPLAGSVTPLDRDYIIIGRDPACCHIVIDIDVISRRHAVLELDRAHGASLVDLASANGTFVNGVPATRRTLLHGDYICLGPDGEAACVYRSSNDSAHVASLSRGSAEAPRVADLRSPHTGRVELDTATVVAAPPPRFAAPVRADVWPFAAAVSAVAIAGLIPALFLISFAAMTLIIALDFVASAVTFGQFSPAAGWLVLGCFIGGLSGLTRSLRCFGHKRQAAAVLTLAVLVLLFWIAVFSLVKYS